MGWPPLPPPCGWNSLGIHSPYVFSTEGSVREGSAFPSNGRLHPSLSGQARPSGESELLAAWAPSPPAQSSPCLEVTTRGCEEKGHGGDTATVHLSPGGPSRARQTLCLWT